MSWFINGVKEWSTDYTTTFNTTQSTTTTFSTSRSTTTTFSTSRSTTTTFSTSRSTTTTFNTSRSTSTTTQATQNSIQGNNAATGVSQWVKYTGNLSQVSLNWWNGNANTAFPFSNPNVTSFNSGGFTFYRGNQWSDTDYNGSCCGGVTYNYFNVAYRTGAITTSFTTTFSTSQSTTTTFNTSQSTTTTFNTSQSTTTTFNTSISTTTTFSTSRTTERTTNFYA